MKKSILMLIVGLVVGLGLTFGVYYFFFRNETKVMECPKCQECEKCTETKCEEKECQKCEKNVSNNENQITWASSRSWTYPVLMSNSSYTNKLNKEFKEKANKSVKINYDNCVENGTSCDDNYYVYKISLIKNCIVINEENIFSSYRASGGSNYRYYTVSNGNGLSNKEILSLYNFNEKDFFNKYINYLKSNTGDNTVTNNVKSLDDINIAPYDDNKIIVTIIGPNDDSEAIYDGAKLTETFVYFEN